MEICQPAKFCKLFLFFLSDLDCWYRWHRVIYLKLLQFLRHSRPQRPRSFWSAPRIATSGQVQPRKSAIHGLPVTLRMFRVKFDKSD